jgi:hypothetical protein
MRMLIIALIAIASYGQAPPSAPSNQAPVYYSHSKQGRVQTRDPRAPRAGGHTATLNWSNTSCTTTKLCLIQAYRNVCASPTSCPAFAGPTGWTLLPSGNVIATPGTSGTTWVATDTDVAMQDATTYVWVATNSYQASPTVYSAPSPPWSGTTSAAPAAPPPPANGPGNTIQ